MRTSCCRDAISSSFVRTIIEGSSLLERIFSPDHFHGVPAHANIYHALALESRAHEDLARTMDLGALLDQGVRTRPRHAVLPHPRGCTPRRRSSGWIFPANRDEPGVQSC